MSGTRWLFISKDYKVFKVSQPKNHVYKPVEELANQEILEVILFYETKNKRPFKLLTVEFDRFSLNSEGRYLRNDEGERRKLHNFFEFGFVTAEELAKRENPLALPLAPIIPTPKEKEVLYKYLKEKLPFMAKEAPTILDSSINRSKQIYQKNIDLIKEATKIRGGRV